MKWYEFRPLLTVADAMERGACHHGVVRWLLEHDGIIEVHVLDYGDNDDIQRIALATGYGDGSQDCVFAYGSTPVNNRGDGWGFEGYGSEFVPAGYGSWTTTGAGFGDGSPHSETLQGYGVSVGSSGTGHSRSFGLDTESIWDGYGDFYGPANNQY